MGEVNWAIYGCGKIAEKRVLPGIVNSRSNRLAGIISRDADRAEGLARKHGASRAYTGLEAALDDPDIYVVYVGTPNAIHTEGVLAALSAGKHVFCDKPLALTVEDCLAMIRSAARHDVKLGVGFNNRYNPVHRDVRDRMAAGQIGKLRFANAQFFLDRPRGSWRLDPALAGGGVVFDMGIHLVDFLRYMTGLEVRRVTAVMDFESYGHPLDAADHGLLEFEGGGVAAVNVSNRIPVPGNIVQYYGSEGSLFLEDTMVTQVGVGLPPSGTLTVMEDNGTTARLTYPVVDLFEAEVEAFGQAIANDTAPEVSGVDGLRALEICLAMHESATRHQAVEVVRHAID